MHAVGQKHDERVGRRIDPERRAREARVAEGFRSIAGKKVGLVTNVTGRARDGRSTIQVLMSPEAKKAGVTLVRLFSPEHGLSTDADAAVASGTDPGTGLSVVSLYGEERRPRPEDLADCDLILLDIQDVGTRFYTYITTGGYVLEEAARAKVPLVVLDRPDPIGGLLIEGPPADTDKLSFTAHHPIPVRYGMTPGELLLLVNGEKNLGADVRVIRMRGWSRDLWYDETGLEWTNPSPNMRSLGAAALYPGVGLLETTNLSVGRGTDTPFEILGAPWLDGGRLAQILNARGIPGVRFSPTRFTPSSSVFAGQRCGGVRLDVVDRAALRAVSVGIEIAVALRDLYPRDWDRKGFVKLLANGAAFGRLGTSTSSRSGARNTCCIRGKSTVDSRQSTGQDEEAVSRIASASISTSMSGEIRRGTSTMVVAGRITPKNSPWALPTFSQAPMSVT